MSDLVAFLRERLKDDELDAAAIAVTGHAAKAQRALREVRAKRIILIEHPQQRLGGRTKRRNEVGCSLCHEDDGVFWPSGYCQTVRALAAVYSDHPSYEKEWNEN